MEEEGDQNRDQNGGESPTTYVRGYQRLPQEDIDMPSTSGWDNKTHTALPASAASVYYPSAPVYPSRASVFSRVPLCTCAAGLSGPTTELQCRCST